MKRKTKSGVGGVEAHMSRKILGSCKVENKTLFNVRIYVAISQSVTACSLGTSLVSSFSILGPGSQNA